ncbi:hypothetical protein KFL_005520010, partial [Klebsormidium nitens]
MASLAPLGVRPPASRNRSANSAPVATVAAVVGASRVTKDHGAHSAPTGAVGTLGDAKQKDVKGVETEVPPADPKEPAPGTGNGAEGGTTSNVAAKGNTGDGVSMRGDNSGREDKEKGEKEVEQGVTEELGAPDEVLVPNAVLVAFPDAAAITKEPLISLVNSEGYSIVSKAELTTHFLPKGWVGTLILKPGASDDPVRLSPSFDPDGGEYVWWLGAGEYVMEAQPKQQRGGLGLGRGGARGVAGGVARTAMHGQART